MKSLSENSLLLIHFNIDHDQYLYSENINLKKWNTGRHHNAKETAKSQLMAILPLISTWPRFKPYDPNETTCFKT